MRRFISEHRLSVSGAAAMFGVERSSLWRFCQSGMARGDTKARYREALATRATKSATGVADFAQLPASQPLLGTQELLGERELRRIRAACEGVLALLNAYEAQSGGQKVLKSEQSTG